MTTISTPPPRPGPEVNSHPTLLTFLTIPSLPSSPFLPSLRTTINSAFLAAHHANPHLRPNNDYTLRLPEPDTLIQQLGADPTTFLLVLHHPPSSSSPSSPPPSEALATITCRRYHGPPPAEKAYPFMLLTSAVGGACEWEIKALAVRPDLQRKGLAGWMLRVAEEEVRRVWEEVTGADGTGRDGKGRLKVVLAALKETQEGFYAKRGYRTEGERERGEGFRFSIVSMGKWLV